MSIKAPRESQKPKEYTPVNIYEEMRNFGMPEEMIQKAEQKELHMDRALSDKDGEIQQREAQKTELLDFIVSGKPVARRKLLEKFGRKL